MITIKQPYPIITRYYNIGISKYISNSNFNIIIYILGKYSFNLDIVFYYKTGGSLPLSITRLRLVTLQGTADRVIQLAGHCLIIVVMRIPQHKPPR